MVNYLTFPGTNFPFISKNDSFAQMLLSDEEMEPVADVRVIRIFLKVRCRYQIDHNQPSIWAQRLTLCINKLRINRRKEGHLNISRGRNPEGLSCPNQGLWLAFMSWLEWCTCESVLEQNKLISVLMSSVLLNLFCSPT